MTVPVVMARTHPPEYRLHKYWSRKPHNVLATFIEALLPGPSTVIDPFCGSGVLLREAALRGHTAIGFDLNPVACQIARVTGAPPDPELFRRAVEPLLDALTERCDEAFGCENGRRVKYVVHRTVVRCPGCGQSVASDQAQGQGRKRTCPRCDGRLRFNLESLVSTRVCGVAFEKHKGLIETRSELARQQKLSHRRACAPWKAVDRELAENRRILAFAGMRVADLFTRRNFGLLSWLARRIEGVRPADVRAAARLWLTASVAQCARLIPYRNNLTTGGPAWSVPGFWVPPVHLETNPATHLRARLKKLITGFERLRATPMTGQVKVQRAEARGHLRSLARKGIRADLVFLDPPYGDSVPYLEFSALWNAFLGRAGDLDADLSVSDRLDSSEAWARYRRGLDRTLEATAGVLEADGKLLITFNNHDLRAWQALLAALQKHRFRCESVTYQLPAVVPAKACFSPKNSYQGDLYAVFSLAPAGWRPKSDLRLVANALSRAAAARAGVLPTNLAMRTAAIAWMENDLDADLLESRDELMAELLVEIDPGLLRWRGPLDSSVVQLEDLVRGAVAARMCMGECSWTELVEAVALATASIGLPEVAEIRAILSEAEHAELTAQSLG